MALAGSIALACAACGTSASLDQPDSTLKNGTLAADCEQLVGGHGLVAQALAFISPDGIANPNPDGNTDAKRVGVQEGLFKIVTAGDKRLIDPVGQLVDFLDDPPAYLRKKNLVAKVRVAASEIRQVCAG